MKLLLIVLYMFTFALISIADVGDIYNCTMDQLIIVQEDGIKQGKLNQFIFEYTGPTLKFNNELDKSMKLELKLGKFSVPQKETFRGHH